MSELDGVIDGLRTTSLLQLLAAFAACIGYVLVQGALLGPRGRRRAGALALLGVAGFILLSDDWTRAVMLVAGAVGGLGVFIAIAWLSSRTLGFARSLESPAEADALSDGSARLDAAAPAAAPVRSRLGHRTGPPASA